MAYQLFGQIKRQVKGQLDKCYCTSTTHISFTTLYQHYLKHIYAVTHLTLIFLLLNFACIGTIYICTV